MNITKNLQTIKQQIHDAEKASHRAPNSVTLLAVSKTHPEKYILEAYEAGQKCFAENYLQEALPKIQTLKNLDIEWHFIGSIQSNKTKALAENFSWVHSVDRFKIAKRLNEQRPESLPPLNICIEVNIHQEVSKSGIVMNELTDLLSEISTLDRLRVRGLMVIPKPTDNKEKQLATYRQVAEEQKKQIKKGFALDTLSMGMTQDFEAAIQAGSTMVRIGTAIFGQRAKH